MPDTWSDEQLELLGELSILDCWIALLPEDTLDYCASTMDLDIIENNLPFWVVNP